LLDLCDRTDLEQILPHLEVVRLDYKRSLYEPGRPIEWVYLPTTGVISLVNTMPDGEAAEGRNDRQ
jgi:hypothetical protein